MTNFAKTLNDRAEGYIALRQSLGYSFQKQASTLRALVRYVEAEHIDGPLTQETALNFVLSWDGTANGRAIRHGVARRFAEYLALYDPQTETLDAKALPRSRAISPPHILSDNELGSLMLACRSVSSGYPVRAMVLATLVGLLASTGLRSGEALRLDRADVDIETGVLHIRKTKFRKDRLVPVHSTTLEALRDYTRQRNLSFPTPKDSAFFLSSRGNRLSPAGLQKAFGAACKIAGFDKGKALRPHDLRHRFAVTRLAVWHREQIDVQALLPVLATYLGHARYSDTAYYVTATADLLGMAAERAFVGGGVA
jgi:integrase